MYVCIYVCIYIFIITELYVCIYMELGGWEAAELRGLFQSILDAPGAELSAVAQAVGTRIASPYLNPKP